MLAVGRRVRKGRGGEGSGERGCEEAFGFRERNVEREEE